MTEFIKRNKKGIIIASVLAVLLSLALTYKAEAPHTVQQAEAATVDRNNVRILLTTLATTGSIDFTINGNYSLKNITDANYSFRNGVLLRKMTYTLKLAGGNIVLNDGTEDFILGNDVTFYCHDASRDSYITVYNPAYKTCNYIGNMRVYVVGGNSLNFINELDMEDYLCGVVPYEMSNKYPIEALKVQAICARSFANYRIVGNPYASYHVIDTQADQVYKGYDSSNDRAIKAIDETARQVLTYNGNFIQAFYSASNGGLTETTGNVWVQNLPYYPVKLDPYDYPYKDVPYGVLKTNISSKHSQWIISKISDEINTLGYNSSTLEILSINHVTPTYNAEPADLPEEDRRVYSIDIELTVKAKNKNTGVYETFNHIWVCKKEAVKTAFYYIKNYGQSNESKDQVGSIPSTRFKVVETDTAIIFYVSGKGHGIGMSQEAAYQRGQAGQTYKEIIDFYYTGTELFKLNVVSYTYDKIPTGEYLDTQASSYTSFETQKQGNIIADTFVKSKAGAIYDNVGSIVYDVEVNILGETRDWFAISTLDGSVTGYVAKKNVFVYSDSQNPDDSKDVMKLGIIKADCDIRSSAVITGRNIVGSVTAGTELIVTDDKLPFYEVIVDDKLVYVLAENITVTDISVNMMGKATVAAYKASIYSAPDDKSTVIGYLTSGINIDIFNVNDKFAGLIYDNKTAYIKLDKINVTESDIGLDYYRPDRTLNAELLLTADTKVYKGMYGTEIIATLKKGDTVRALALENNFYKIIYKNSEAYIEADTAKISADIIINQYAVLIADKTAYTDAGMQSPAETIRTGTALKIKAKTGDVLAVSYNGSTYYITTADIDIRNGSAVADR